MSEARDRKSILRRIDDLQHQIYDLRRQLAADDGAEQLPEGALNVLCCRVGTDHVAFLEASVEEVVMMARLVSLPEASAWVPGLLNLRGATIPVIDLAVRVTERARRPGLDDLIVICVSEGRRVGLLVQEVLGIKHCDSDDVEPPPRSVSYAPYLLGVFHLEGMATLLLSVASLIANSDLPQRDS